MGGLLLNWAFFVTDFDTLKEAFYETNITPECPRGISELVIVEVGN